MIDERFKFLPKHSVADRTRINHNGAHIPNSGLFVRSGTLGPVAGSTTGSIEMNFDATALRLRRVEVFHSGAAASFNISLDNSTPNTGSFYDARSIITCYNEVPGSTNFTSGLDQVEDMYALTDCAAGSEGNLYLKVMPYGTGDNTFNYLLFFEAAVVYVNKDGERHR